MRSYKGYPSRLVVLIVALVFILIGVTSVFLFNNQKKFVLDDEFMHLETISAYKQMQIDEWIRERVADANALSSNLNLIKSIDNYVKHRKTGDGDFIKTRFDAYINFMKYSAIFLIDLEGHLLLESPEKVEHIDSKVKAMALGSIEAKGALMGEIVHCDYHNENHWDVYVPVFQDYSTKMNPVAIMIFRTDAYSFISHSITSYPLPTETAEGLLVEVVDGQIRVLTPTRHDPEAALQRVEKVNDHKKALLHALNNQPKVDSSIDYRGKEVYGIVRPIEHKDWYLITKIDKSEALKPLRRYLYNLIILDIFIFFIVMLMLAISAKTIQHRRLKEIFQEQKDRQALLQHFMYIVKYANDIIYLCDDEDRIVQYNDSALSFYGYTPEEFENLAAEKLIDPKTYQGHKDIYSHEDYVQGVVLDTLHVTKDGTIKPVEASIRAIEIDDKHYYQCIVRDIGERKAAEEIQEKLHNEIRELNKGLEDKVLERTSQLQTAYEELESFSYNVSHDLRAPLRSIRGFSEALMEDFAEHIPQEARDHLSRICNASHSMNELITSLMELSKLSTRVVSLRNTNVSKLIEELCQELMEQNPELELDISYPPEIIISADASMLQTALRNIFSNAIKFCSKHRKPEIVIDFEDEEEKTIISITDNGVGFDMKYAFKLFSPFQRLHTVEQYPGSGIGLSIVKRVMLRHNGDARIFSQKDVGTTVYLDFFKGNINHDSSISDKQTEICT